MDVYRKDSMDRFGDNLTEEVLQYLTFKDKIRLECVSKQWQRCVFEKQFVLEICKRYQRYNSLKRLFTRIVCSKQSDEESDGEEYSIYQLNIKRLQSVLKKCPNIKKIITYETLESSVCEVIDTVITLSLCISILVMKYRWNSLLFLVTNSKNYIF